jgi:SAM-dependent methyltransferase
MIESLSKPKILTYIHCPKCGSELHMSIGTDRVGGDHLNCIGCGNSIPVQNRAPIFTTPPSELIPSDKLVRGPEVGTPWRQANWRFLAEQIAELPSEALILDVGAGRGDFAAAFTGRKYYALDIYPYPEIDIVCDLTQTNPFKAGSFDMVVLMNVIEHVYDTGAILAAVSQILKPGALAIVAIPFMVKIHQAPVDFVRYTHFALGQIGKKFGLQAERLEGYYDPIFFLGEGLGNLRNAFLPRLHGARRQTARVLLTGIQSMANLLQRSLGPGQTIDPINSPSMAPTGYHVVYRKVEG